MSIEVIPLGVNGAFTRTGLHTNYLVRFGTRRLLIDCGPSAGKGLERIGENITDIDLVYISHLHLDHIGGLFELGLRRFFLGLPPPKVFLHESLVDSIWNHALSGMMEYYFDRNGSAQRASSATFFHFVPVTDQQVSELEAIDMRGLAVRVFPVNHIPNSACHGVVIDDQIACTTDTTFLPHQLETVANKFGVETIFHDCSFIESESVVHTTYRELLSLPSDLQDLLILTHYQDVLPLEKAEIKLRLGEASKVYSFDGSPPAP